jgi:uncharacterized protein (TIGR01319 family)
MSNIQLLVDFGSTSTKIVAVDLEEETIVSRAHVPSTVDQDITIGLRNAIEKIRADVDIGPSEIRETLACSSAAGGLRMVAIGFVPELTCEAASRAALNAGAKVIGCYSNELTEQERVEIEDLSPDIILLAGGTDGGNKKVILHNAAALAGVPSLKAHIVVAGNKAAQDEARAILAASGKPVSVAKNVMPQIGTLDIDPCREVVRETFIRNIIEAKGIGKARSIVKDIIMPTPVAVLTAAQLLSEGFGRQNGWGELVVADVGGATTDIHSIASGVPTRGGVLLTGLPEPYVKRTVEGDLGVRHNIRTLLGQARKRGRLQGEAAERLVAPFTRIEKLPETDEEFAFDEALAAAALEIATERHCGKLEMVYGPAGEMPVQRGKDLTKVETVIGTGGPVIFSRHPKTVLEQALFDERHPFSLRPKRAQFYVDRKYILYAIGLLAGKSPEKALGIGRRYITPA